MKRHLLFTGMILSLLLSCKNQEKSIIHSDVIEIEQGLQNLTRLKTSDFGKTIRYIPLETTDDGLVGDSPIIKVLRNYIVVESQGRCLLFDKNDGSFITQIGRIGQGPDEYSDIFSWIDEKEEFLYFQRRPNQLLKYDMKGNFCDRVKFSDQPELASYYLLTDSEIIGYFTGIFQINHFALGFFDKEGALKDSISLLLPKTPVTPDEIANLSILRSKSAYGLFGNWGQTGVILINLKNDTRQITFPNAARMWKNNGNIRFKEDFADTLYTYTGQQFIPSIVFNTGKYHWPYEERTSTKNPSERIFIADVSENDNFVFFQCIRGVHSDSPVIYNGLYHKYTGETKLSNNNDAIEDDLTHFMPFTPLSISTAGEFVSYVEAYVIMDWLEEHPEAKNNEKLSFLKGLDAEMNPVIILIE